MRVYNATGRMVISSLWDGLVGVPANIQEVAAFTDPGALRYVGWSVANGRLELLTFAASDIPYDDSVTVLGETDVQGAIEAVTALVDASPVVYAGYVAANGLTYSVPSGWSVSKGTTGKYTVTHGLGLSNVTDLSIVVTGYHPTSSIEPKIASVTANSFEVHTYISSLANTQWFFLAAANA